MSRYRKGFVGTVRAGRAAIVLVGVTLAVAPRVRAVGWTGGTGGPTGRNNAGMAYHEGLGRTVVFGGYLHYPNATNETLLFDGSEWAPGPAAPAGLVARGDHAMAYDRVRGVMVVFGGFDRGVLFDDTWELDAAGWTPGPPAPPGLTPRAECSMAYDAARGRMVLFGGASAGGLLGEVWEYDGASWSMAAPPPPALTPRRGASMAYDEVRQRLVLFGGEDGAYRDDTWEYDGSAWSPGPPAPLALMARLGAAMTFDPTRQLVLLFGGFDAAGAPRRDTWLYDGASWTPGPAAPAGLRPRTAHGLASDSSRGQLVLFGGGFGLFADVLSDTWQLDGAGWRQDPLYPHGRKGHAMVFDAARGVGVLFGGYVTFDNLDETWELDGSTWRRGPAAPAGLTGRQLVAASFDAARARTVIHGGWEGTAPAGDTWEYDGTAWMAGAASPPAMLPRYWASMAYDPVRQVSVLFGGILGSLAELDETWEYDGASWAPGPPAPAGMVARYGASMDFDPSRGVIVLTGGYSGGAPLGDVWLYDGTAWTAGPPLPPLVAPRLAHTMTYDLARGRMVMFGGGDDPDPGQGSTFTDVWELGVAGWSPGALPPLALHGRRQHSCYYDAGQSRVVVFGGTDAGHVLRGDVWEYGGVRAAILAGGGDGPGVPNRVRAFDESGQPAAFDITAYAAGTWGASGTGAQVAGTALAEVVTGPGPGPSLGPQVRGFARDGTALAKVSFFAYATLRYGVGVAGGSLDGDPYDEVVTAAGAGAVFGPHVRGWNVDGAVAAPVTGVSFFAYGTPRFGAVAAAGDVDGDGFAEILTGPGPGPSFGAQVRGFDVDGAGTTSLAKINFDAFGGGFGARPSAGDVDRDGFADIAVAPGPGPSLAGRFRGFGCGGTAVHALAGFDSGALPSHYGGRPSLGDLAGDPAAELLAAPGPDPGATALVDALSYDGAALASILPTISAFPSQTYGVNVGAGMLGL